MPVKRTVFLAPDSDSSAGEPEAMTWPASTMCTRSESTSASSMKWVVSTVVTPPARSSSIRSQVARRACGSRPAVGSSRNSSCGRPMTAIARLSRCCWPPERRRYGVRPHDPSPSRSTSGVGVERVGVQRRHVPQHLPGANARPGATGLQHDADLRPQRAGVGDGIEAQHPHRAVLGAAEALAGLDGGGLAGAVRARGSR